MVSSQRTQLLRREDEGLKENVLVIADLCQIPPLEANYSFYICGLGLSVSPWKQVNAATANYMRNQATMLRLWSGLPEVAGFL